MGLVQIVATSVAAAITVVAIVLVVRTVRRMISVVRLGQPDPDRGGSRGLRLKTMLAETLGHTRMLRWTVVGAAHWFVMIASSCCRRWCSRRTSRSSAPTAACR